MPRRRHDALARDLLFDRFAPLGQVQCPGRVHGEERQIDLLYTPGTSTAPPGYRQHVGVLSTMARGVAGIEVFRNPCTASEVLACIGKLVELHALEGRATRRAGRRLSRARRPRMWVLTPWCPPSLHRAFTMRVRRGVQRGFYDLDGGLHTTLVVLSQLPEVPETLWLRLLGRGATQQRAIDELEALPDDHPFRDDVIRRVLRWRLEAEAVDRPNAGEQELIMNTERLLTRWENQIRAAGKNEGIALGKSEGIALGKSEGIALGKSEGIALGKSEGIALGATQGKIEALFAVLQARGFRPSAALTQRIRGCIDGRQLDAWVARAAVATSIDEVFPKTASRPRASRARR